MKLLWCTGWVVHKAVHEMAGCRPCVFEPQMAQKLATPYRCYTNYFSENFGGFRAEAGS